MSANPRDAFQFRVPRTFILEGKSAESWQLKNGSGEVVKTILHGGGWRFYQFIVNGKSSVTMSRPMTAQSAREKFNAKFYAAGTWEDESKPTPPDTMPVPRPEILKEVFNENPAEEKRQLQFA